MSPNEIRRPLVQRLPDINFLSQLYAQDVPDSCLLAEYPSSNSAETCFQNRGKFEIHDPFPPPKPELLKVLGPHHLMFGWGNELPVASEQPPPEVLLAHWKNVLGAGAVPVWQKATTKTDARYVTLFPHAALRPQQQVIDPEVNYQLHSKTVIEKIDCPQARVLDQIEYPCIVKLSHGYAGLGNFIVRDEADESAMRKELETHWPDAEVVINSLIPDIVGDYGVQFYLRPDGSAIWLGLTEQRFNAQLRWCGGVYRSAQQKALFDVLSPVVTATAHHLSGQGYQGVVGIDILETKAGEYFLVDVNPRLTGITPFLIAARIFDRDYGLKAGIYQASVRFAGTLKALIDLAQRRWEEDQVRIVVLSAFETPGADSVVTTCHVSASGETLAACQSALRFSQD